MICNIFMCYFSFKNLKEIKKNRESESRPYIYIDIVRIPNNHICKLIIENIGRLPANIINIDINPMVDIRNKEQFTENMKNNIIPGGKSLEFLINANECDWNKLASNSYECNVLYEDSFKTYRNSYTIKLNHLHNDLYMKDELIESLKSISNNLEKIYKK